MKKIETYGNITNGKLEISYKLKFLDAIKNIGDCRVIVTVEKIYRKRTTNENAYYWACVVPFYQQGTYDIQGEQISKEQAHERLKQHCNYVEHINEQTGECLKFIIDTKSLSTVEFEEYLEKCRRFIYEWFNITVPLPNEQSDLFL